ncbi:glucokinase [Roseomonas sp. 18066]|uniref:glucokinase n=1 Tax=Roseomonas sp. 18066 TaxID=2681412 RepID=UPI00135C805B|nr:glucokinase [Roseomonas sp. 18066]
MTDAPLRLIGDIGGTNARFALCRAGGLPEAERKLPVEDHAGLVEAAQAYLEGRAVEEAVLAVATPVLGDAIAFTNSPWRFSIQAAERALGLRKLTIINDFVAQAAAIPLLEARDMVVLQAGEARPRRPRLVIGPGTGLGVAFLQEDSSGRHQILPSEGGHASFAPQDGLQAEILKRMRKLHGGHVSQERLVSGPGLLEIAQILAEMEGVVLTLESSRDVSDQAQKGEPVCAQAVTLFCEMLGAVAGNLALSLLTEGGVYVAGGLCRTLGPLLDGAAIRRGFAAKGRFEGYLKALPMWQVLRPHTGLLGAAAYHH